MKAPINRKRISELEEMIPTLEANIKYVDKNAIGYQECKSRLEQLKLEYFERTNTHFGEERIR